MLNQILTRKMDSLNIVFSIILALYQMLPWKETRELIIKNEELIKLVLNCLRCPNEQINFISMRFLEIVQIFEAKWSEKIKEEKFKLYNNDLINQIVEVQAKLQLMRETRKLPVMRINPDVKDIFSFRYEDFQLQGYDPWPHIKAEVAV